MSHTYYYLVASLPTLYLDSPLIISYEQFLSLSKEQLSSNDFLSLTEATLSFDVEQKHANPCLNAWARFNRNLRNEIARYRATRGGKDPLDYIRGEKSFEPRIMEVVQEAARAENPLMGEKILDRFRWRYLDELILGHYFDLDALMVYALKLQILERYTMIQSGKGKEIFESYKTASHQKSRDGFETRPYSC